MNKDHEDGTLFWKEVSVRSSDMWKREGLNELGMKTIMEVKARGLRTVDRTFSGIADLTLSLNVK